VHASTPSLDTGSDPQNDPTARHGDIDRDGNIVDQLHLTVRERAQLRDRISRARLALPDPPAPRPPRPARRKDRPRPLPVRPPEPARTYAPAGRLTLAELDPETRTRAERLLEVIPAESSGREAQACFVALAVARCRP